MFRWLRPKKTRIEPTTPGPSPWFLNAPWSRIRTAEGEWLWQPFHSPNPSGPYRLLRPDGCTVLFLSMYCYVHPLPNDRILVWYEAGRFDDVSRVSPCLVFTILELATMIPFEVQQEIVSDVAVNRERLQFRGGLVSSFDLSTTVWDGTHVISPPDEFSCIGEILALAEAGSKGSDMCRAIFVCDFGKGQTTVLPQKWFNDGSYDFGYQWITRVQREPSSGQIVGEGTRIRNFKLDTTGMRIQEWLHLDVFYDHRRRWL
jgi:hypothetical protein